jgi:hypothetical protein
MSTLRTKIGQASAAALLALFNLRFIFRFIFRFVQAGSFKIQSPAINYRCCHFSSNIQSKIKNSEQKRFKKSFESGKLVC